MASVFALNFGFPVSDITAGPSFNNISLSASTTKYGSAFALREGATITHLGFRYGVRTGTPPTYRISLQSLDTAGVPDGTVLGGGSPASATFTPPADATWNSTFQWIALTNSYAATRGQVLSIVVEYSSGTVDGSNFSSYSNYVDGYGSTRVGFPYTVSNTGSWSKSGSRPVYGLKSSSNVYGFPVQTATTTTPGTSGHRAAMKFSLPSGVLTSYTVAGARLPMTTGGTWKLGLWDAAGTVIQDATLDGDHTVSTGSTLREHTYYFDETTLTALTPGTAYYLGIERGATNLELYSLSVAAANDMKAFPGGDGFTLATWNGSAWSETTTARPIVEVILDDMTPIAGGGGATLFVPVE